MRLVTPPVARVIVVFVAMSVALLVGARPASAESSAYVSAGVLYYYDDVANELQLEAYPSGASYTISTPGDPITPYGGCAADSATRVTCSGATRISLNLGDGRDVATVSSTLPATIDAGAGSDGVSVSNTATTVIDAGPGDDLIGGGNGNDYISGGDGQDNIGAFGGYNEVDGGADDDMLAGQGFDILRGGAGDDQLGTFGTGGRLYGGEGADHLTDGDGDAAFDGGPGADYFEGGAGSDTVSYSARTLAVSVTDDGVGNDGEAGEFDHLDSGIEVVRGGSGNDRLVGFSFMEGNRGNDVLISSDANTLRGGPGDDLIRGGVTQNIMQGGTGIDTVDYSSHAAGVSVDLGSVLGNGAGSENDIVSEFEAVIGTNAADVLIGTGAAERLVGRGGGDTIAAEGGNDVLDGGPGRDTLRGGDNDDTLLARDGVVDTVVGGSGNDRARVDRTPFQKVTDVRSSIETLLA